MALPIPARSVGTITIDGVDVPVRSLTAREATAIRSFDDPSDRNVYLIACAFDLDKDEAQHWYDSVDAAVALAVLEGITTVSGMSPAEAKRFPASDDDVDGGGRSGA